MLNTPAHSTTAVIVGAGPYGLSVAAHLAEAGVPFRIFGRPMQSWSTQMPRGMHLRSNGATSNLSPGSKSFTLTDFCLETGRPAPHDGTAIALEHFAAYGEEFARRFVPQLEQEQIRSIDRTGREAGPFRVTAASGEGFFAGQVVIATGLSHMQHVPAALRHLPSSRVTHPAAHRDYSQFTGRDVTVLGSGASALNAAVLLHEAGAQVTLVARARRLHVDSPEVLNHHAKTKPHDSHGLRAGVFVKLTEAAPDLYRALPKPLQRLWERDGKTRSGDSALHGRVKGFTTLLGCRLHAVEAADGGCERLRLTLTDSHGQPRQHLTSHLIAATGYRFDKDRLGMLSQSMREQIRVNRAGAPKLNHGFESSVPGLRFVGPLAAPSFGSTLGALAGIRFAATRVTSELQRHAQRVQTREMLRSAPRVEPGFFTRRERAL